MNDTDFRKTLWDAANKLRSNMDAAEYKHVVLGLIFLKYISDTFRDHRDRLAKRFANPKDDYYIAQAGKRDKELEERDYYLEANVFWVPEPARWETIRNQAKQPQLGKLIDDALIAIEADNPRLKGVLDKRFARTQLGEGKLGELVDLISSIGFTASDKSKDVLGQVYEYFLGQFASAEGKQAGQFYTPESIVKTLAAVLSPHKGKVYDPCCGSGGMFVQSEKFIESHGGKFGDISIYGQEDNPTTWRLAAMNLAIRGMDFNLGKENGDTFARDMHPDLKADYILANPPFNMKDWGGEKYVADKRWVYGTPPVGNANFAWLQHILHHLKPGGCAGVVLSNGSMSSNTNNEGIIRQAMVEADVVECMLALPPQLFFNTPIPACLWFLTRDKTKNGRDRRRETLFIDARKLGRMETRVRRVFDQTDIDQIADTFHAWRKAGEIKNTYSNIPGFCQAALTKEIAAHQYVLTPGRYVGTEEAGDDDEAFAEKMERLTAQLAEQMAKGTALDAIIREKLDGLGYAV